VTALAKHFKDDRKNPMDLPDWHDIVKTASQKELGPYSKDWYYIRAASMARKIYIRGGTGVGAFSKMYGQANKRSVTKAHFERSSRGLIRHILKQLGEMGVVSTKKQKKGRFITQAGQALLDSIAVQVAANIAPAAFRSFVAEIKEVVEEEQEEFEEDEDIAEAEE